jgi:hypothetical protein
MRPENSAANSCRYNRKILASNYQIRPENSASGNYRNGRKIPAGNRLIVIASCIQSCSGAVVEHLVHNLKVGGLRLSCAQTLFHYTAGKFRWRRKSTEISGSHAENFFCSMYEMSQRHPVWVTENHVNPFNSVVTAVDAKVATILGSIQHLPTQRNLRGDR